MASTEGDFRGLHQFSVVSAAFIKDDEERNDYEMVDYAIHRLFYAGIAVIFMMIVALVVKLMWNCDGDGDGGGGRVNESSRLLPSPEKDEGDVDTFYGGTDDTVLESGSSSSSSSWTSSEDGKVCVICYDDPRECLFIPCGHCIACHACAIRIMKQEGKSCPICRGTIDKMSKLQIS